MDSTSKNRLTYEAIYLLYGTLILIMSKTAKHKKLISCVVPVFNEEVLIAEFIAALDKTLKSITYPYEILLIDEALPHFRGR
ncbi:glycosyltransferase, group 2 family protein (glycan biosynthesis) [Legionella pneumophila]|nr:glycosyltransferase, group 2 family protein (glycan biosynthesis) [Legionella pneumophila]